jgi:hypothetical protein
MCKCCGLHLNPEATHKSNTHLAQQLLHTDHHNNSDLLQILQTLLCFTNCFLCNFLQYSAAQSEYTSPSLANFLQRTVQLLRTAALLQTLQRL